MAPMAPLHRGFMALLVVSALYEPVRQALYRLDEQVGGVGGVGGLTNQWPCMKRGAFGPYVCFHRGVLLGLTPFALVVLLLWTVPLAASAAVASLSRKGPETPCAVGSFGTFWAALELLWFSVPAAAYMSDPFYKSSAWHVILGLSISSAFPLSWSLSLVAIPGSARVMSPLTGLSKAASTTIHKTVARSAVRWATLHGFGELLFLCAAPVSAQGERRGAAFREGPYRFLFWAGAASGAVLLLHVVVACLRRRFTENFASAHRAIAALLLVCAAIHWWPFVFFLCPAIAVFATARALDCLDDDGDVFTVASRSLSASLVATVCGVCVVSYVRQFALIGTHDYSPGLPFAFPPVSLALGYLLARAAAALAVHVHYRTRPEPSEPGFQPLNG